MTEVHKVVNFERRACASLDEAPAAHASPDEASAATRRTTMKTPWLASCAARAPSDRPQRGRVACLTLETGTARSCAHARCCPSLSRCQTQENYRTFPPAKFISNWLASMAGPAAGCSPHRGATSGRRFRVQHCARSPAPRGAAPCRCRWLCSLSIMRRVSSRSASSSPAIRARERKVKRECKRVQSFLKMTPRQPRPRLTHAREYILTRVHMHIMRLTVERLRRRRHRGNEPPTRPRRPRPARRTRRCR